jgi:hypothetical protein
MAQKKRPSLVSFNLPDDEAALRLAKDLARSSGRQVVVSDETGFEIALVEPSPANVIIIAGQKISA